MHLKRTHAAVKGAEKFHTILSFETHCIIRTTVYGGHEIIYGIISEYYETRQCKTERKNKNIIREKKLWIQQS